MSPWLRPRWLVGHVIVGVVAVVFLRLGWWQWQHARQGNTLSYGYALQWPLFAAFGVFFWVKVVRERLSHADVRRQGGRPQAAVPSLGHSWRFERSDPDGAAPARMTPAFVTQTDAQDPQVAAYEDMLRWLNDDPRRHVSDYPGFQDR
ncbi:hypothetical protein [Micromonospora sp. DT227]|uniref:hypothetical protein n=1 Tax=Micromonospora sp. DT227 TaxID=3393433 RepID=UPI003CF5EA3C